MKTISHSALVALISAAKGATPIGITAVTEAKMNKKSRDDGKPSPFGSVSKRTTCVAFCGADYERAVVREGARQGVDAQDFTAQSLPWGTWLVPGKIITHDGQYYLRLQWTPGQVEAQPPHSEYIQDDCGAKISKEMLSPWLPPASKSRTQEAAGLDGQIVVRTFAFRSLSRVRIFGEEYTVEQTEKLSAPKQMVSDTLKRGVINYLRMKDKGHDSDPEGWDGYKM